MTRRDLLRLTGSSLLYTSLAPLAGLAAARPGNTDRLFFGPADAARARANAGTPLLQPLYQEWAGTPPADLLQAMDKFEKTGEIIRDFMAVVRGLGQHALVQLVEPTDARSKAMLEILDRLCKTPHWDYFRDGGTEVIGIQRASFATVRVLFAREVLGEAIDPELDKRLMAAVADKGCLPCYRTVYDMENPDTVEGWDFDELHAGFYDITMERWPMILGANNLRAAPTGALGLGALALMGKDKRADKWLEMAVASTQRFLKLFSSDGSYYEGISYLSYSLRTMLPFMKAHQQLVGDVDWLSHVNFNGMLDYIMTMQMGKKADGAPDIVNFSDSRNSVFPGAISLIGDWTGNTMAGYASREAGKPDWIYDFLWYKPDAPSTPPRKELLNWRNDLNWIICRSGWEPRDTVVAFKSGGPANHEHADRNHITFKAFGERLLNDHFGASYDRRNPGWKMRLPRAHNCVLIDGKGHPYIEGLEGTNDSQAYANVLQFHEEKDAVWWTSDASAAYILNNYHVLQVLRSVVYLKPQVLVVIDQVRLHYRPQVMAARFFPDNADGKAGLAVNGNRFVISRPQASLHGLVASSSATSIAKARLEVPRETGDFPCVEIRLHEALTHRMVTVLTAVEGHGEHPHPGNVFASGDQWKVTTADATVDIHMKTFAPEIKIS